MGTVGPAAVLIVDTIRTGDNRPERCAGVLERGASGELLDDTAVVDRAWAAVRDRDGARDLLDPLRGSGLVTRRTCVVYAGVLIGAESARRQPGPTVVFAESNIGGHQNLARFAEVRLPASDSSAGAPLVAVAAHAVLFGNELAAGLARVALQVYLDPGVPVDIATARRVAALLPELSADARVRALLDNSRRYPNLRITFSPDGRQATVRPADPDAQPWATIQLPVRD